MRSSDKGEPSGQRKSACPRDAQTERRARTQRANLLDVPAEIVALLYRHRWTIVIFFRFFKQILGCRHLLSHSRNGVEIQTYCAIIACLLTSLWTGRNRQLPTTDAVIYVLEHSSASPPIAS